jgi:hypothetical protein
MRSARFVSSLRWGGWPLLLATASCAPASTESVPDDAMGGETAVAADGGSLDAGDAAEGATGDSGDAAIGDDAPAPDATTDSAVGVDAGPDAVIVTDTSVAPDTRSPTDGTVAGDTGSGVDASDAHPATDAGGSVDASVWPTGSDVCATAPDLPLASAQRLLTIPLDTTGAAHSIAPPCATGTGPERFFSVSFSRPVVFYADTFGTSFDTVLYLLSSVCAPLTTSTMTGDVLCSDDGCGTSQSQIVALLKPGSYVLGVAGKGSAAGPATLHLAWAFAASGIEKPLPKGSSVQTGTTSGAGNIDGLSSSCLAAGPEDNYWWTSCPADAAGTLSASTCGGATWESVVSLQVPGSIPYACTLDTCGFQSALAKPIPAGAGLRVLTVDGQGGTAAGAYTLTVTRP